MTSLSARTADDLLEQLGAVDITVPLRSEGRRKEHTERWSICRLLATYAKTSLLQYPLRLEKGERPDFVLHLPSRSVGIEVTEAVPPDWAWADARRDKLNYDKLVFLHRFRPGEPKRSKAEIDNIARGATVGDGWAGDAPEREWADVMLHFMDRKAERLRQPGYARHAADWLLVYDNWPLPAVKHERAAAKLLERVASTTAPAPFERVFVECERAIWQFTPPTVVAKEIVDVSPHKRLFAAESC